MQVGSKEGLMFAVPRQGKAGTVCKGSLDNLKQRDLHKTYKVEIHLYKKIPL